MKIFGIEIGKSAEKRGIEDAQLYTPYSTSLTFGQLTAQTNAMALSAVFRAVEIISDSIAMLPIDVKLKNGKNHRDVIENHSFYGLLNGNKLSKYNFMKLLVQSVLLRGNGFAYIERNVDGSAKSLRFIESSDVSIQYNKSKNELFYQCAQVSSKRIEPCNMIHLVKNSYDGINGVSVLTYANRSIKNANNTESSANNFFESGCNLSGVLTVQGQLNPQQIADIKSSWANAYTTGGNGIAVLQGNMSYQPIQLSAADAQMLDSRKYNVQDIARFFGISPILLGDYSNSAYGTIEATQQQFLLHTLQPYIVMIEEEFSRKLLKPSESDLEICLEESYLLKSDKVAEANYYTTLINSGVLCVNEVRKQLGYSEIEGGDKHIIPFTDINQNTINKSTEDGEGN